MNAPSGNQSEPLVRKAYPLPDTAPAATALDHDGRTIQTGHLISANWTSSQSTLQHIDPSSTPPTWPTPVPVDKMQVIRIPVHGQPSILQVREFTGPLASDVPQGPLGVADCALASSGAADGAQCTYTMTDSEIRIRLDLQSNTSYFVVFGQWYLSMEYTKDHQPSNNLASWTFACSH